MIIKLDRNKHTEMRSLTVQMLGANKAFFCAQKQKGDSPPSLLGERQTAHCIRCS